MDKYILIHGYTPYSEHEIEFWNKLSIKIGESGYKLFLLSPKKFISNIKLEYAFFYEKLDQVNTDFYVSKNESQQGILKKYLKREEIWYGESNKNNRQEALEFQIDSINLLLDELNPCIIVLGNGQHAIDLVLKDEASTRGIEILYFERGCLPNSWHIDKSGVTAGTVIAKKAINEIKLPEFDNLFFNYRNSYFSKRQTWWQQPKDSDISIRNKYKISLETKIILFANQLDNDTSNFLYSPLFDSNIEAFIWFCKYLNEKKLDCFVIAKKHPWYSGDNNVFYDVLKKYNVDGVWVDNISIFNCLEQSDLVVSVNSTLNFEALIYEMPVLQLGQSILSNKDITYELIDINNTEILNDWFNSKELNCKISVYKRFISYMIANELIFYDIDRADEGLNDFNFFAKKVINQIPKEKRFGIYPKLYLENIYKSQLTNYDKIPVRKLFIIILRILSNIIKRVIKKLI